MARIVGRTEKEWGLTVLSPLGMGLGREGVSENRMV